MTVLASVNEAIGDIIVDFAVEQQRAGNPPFHMSDLNQFVMQKAPVAPDSPGRILRGLKASGVLDYVLVSRHQSLYRFK